MTNIVSIRGGYGNLARTPNSIRTEFNVKIASELVFDALKETYGSDVTWKRKLNKDEIPGGEGACQPDGGVFYYRGQIVAMVEAKKQNDQGNAIERWFKNYHMQNMIAPNAALITFCSGEGAVYGGMIWKTLSTAHYDMVTKRITFNVIRENGPSTFLSREAAAIDDVYDIVLATITRKIENLRLRRAA